MDRVFVCLDILIFTEFIFVVYVMFLVPVVLVLLQIAVKLVMELLLYAN